VTRILFQCTGAHVQSLRMCNIKIQCTKLINYRKAPTVRYQTDRHIHQNTIEYQLFTCANQIIHDEVYIHHICFVEFVFQVAIGIAFIEL
jgi:hypothetical protein